MKNLKSFPDFINESKKVQSTKVEYKGKTYYVDDSDPNDTKYFAFEDPELTKNAKTSKGTLMFKKKDIEEFLKEGTWAFDKKVIKSFIDELENLEVPHDINDSMYDEYFNKVGDDELFDYLDTAKEGGANWKKQVKLAIKRLKELQNIKEDNESELGMGIKTEAEHSNIYDELEEFVEELNMQDDIGGEIMLPWTKEEFYQKIAEAHIKEIPDYYTRLHKMENE